MHDILYIGNCCVDFYTTKKIRYPGGSALNFVYHGTKNSSDVGIGALSAIGNDDHGILLEKFFKKNGLSTSHLLKKSGITPTQFIENTETGEKVFTKYVNGVLDNFRLTKKQQKDVADVTYAVTTVFEQLVPTFHDVLAAGGTSKKVVDFRNLADFGRDISIVKNSIDKIDICFFGLTKKDILVPQLLDLAKKHNKMMVITLAEDGSIAYANNKIYAQSVLDADVKDTTGCGDSYLAGFVTEYIKTGDVQKSMHKGTEIASRVAEHFGPINKTLS